MQVRRSVRVAASPLGDGVSSSVTSLAGERTTDALWRTWRTQRKAAAYGKQSASVDAYVEILGKEQQ